MIPARPAITPLRTAIADGLCLIHEIINQTTPLTTAALCVATTVDTANGPLCKALPALNPNHEVQRSAPPSAAKGKFDGGNSPLYLLKSFLCSKIIPQSKAETPDVV